MNKQWQLSKSSRYYKVLAWAWGEDEIPSKGDIASFCKLFWLTVLLPMSLVSYRLIFKVVPRLAFLYACFSLVLLATGNIGNGFTFAAIALFLTVGGIVFTRRKKANKTPLIQRFLDWTEKPSTGRTALIVLTGPIWLPFVAAWYIFVLHLIKLADLVSERRYRRRIRKVNSVDLREEKPAKVGAKNVIVRGAEAFHKKTCPMVKIVE